MEKRFLVAVALIVIAIMGVQSEEKTDFFLGVGLGWEPLINYPSSDQASINSMKSYPGVQEINMNLNFDLGFKIFEYETDTLFGKMTSYNYLTLGVNGMAKRLSDNSGSFQVNNYVYGAGLTSIQGHVLATMLVGPALGVAQISGTSGTVSIASDVGYGIAGQMGYVTNGGKGFGAFIGLCVLTSWISSDEYSGVGLVANLTYY